MFYYGSMHYNTIHYRICLQSDEVRFEWLYDFNYIM